MTDNKIFETLNNYNYNGGTVKLSDCAVCGDINGMIKSHLGILKSENSETVKRPYRQRLIDFINRYVEQR